jgi:hypothetical protein
MISTISIDGTIVRSETVNPNPGEQPMTAQSSKPPAKDQMKPYRIVHSVNPAVHVLTKKEVHPMTATPTIQPYTIAQAKKTKKFYVVHPKGTPLKGPAYATAAEAQRVADAKTKAAAIAAEVLEQTPAEATPEPQRTTPTAAEHGLGPAHTAALKGMKAFQAKQAAPQAKPPTPAPEAATPAPKPTAEDRTPLVKPEITLTPFTMKKPDGYWGCLKIVTPTGSYIKAVPKGLRTTQAEALALAADWRAAILQGAPLPEPRVFAGKAPATPAPVTVATAPKVVKIEKVMPGVTRVMVD